MKQTITGSLALLLLVAGALQADNIHKVAPETFRGSIQATPKSMPGLRLQPLPPIAARAAPAAATGSSTDSGVVLPALNVEEVEQLQSAAGKKALRVGVGRQLPADFQQVIDLDAWRWTATAEGRIAHFTLTSTGATRVRAQLELASAPPGVELRLFAPGDASRVFGPYTEAASFWSPTVEGEALGLELFLPSGVMTSEVMLRIPQLSHLVVNPASSQMKSSLFKETEYASCQLDIACAASEWQETGKSVARYVFTDTDGLSYVCSGTLLADTDPSTQIPYFFTASHCVNNASAAATMDMFWLYRTTSCGGEATNFVQTTGGAQLLANRPELDTTFLQLNNDPPAGVNMAGWTTQPLTSGQDVTGLHHALGYPQKYAHGDFQGHVRIDASSGGYIVVPDSGGDFSQVIWHTGITAPGSSGSGVWLEDNGIHYLNGSLLGGTSNCGNMNAPDEYSRFERTWPYVSEWLDANVPEPTLYLRGAQQQPAALVEGVLITRYLQGVRGNALTNGVTSQTLDIPELEAALARALSILDIDDDGSTEANSDAVLLTRYLLGLRGAPLIQGVDLTQSGRKGAAAIEAYIVTLLAE